LLIHHPRQVQNSDLVSLAKLRRKKNCCGGNFTQGAEIPGYPSFVCITGLDLDLIHLSL